MKRSFSPARSKATSSNSHHQLHQAPRTPINKSVNYCKYFCHYNNAVYMGGMSSYKKHGKGILLHDDGSTVITEYLNGNPAGHNLIFRQNSITSMLNKTPVEFQVAYKQGNHIITIPFIDITFKAHGVGCLIDYHNHKIYRLTFRRGELVQKILHLDKKDNDDVFNRNTITKVIGVKHQQAFSLTFQKPNGVHIKTQKNKTTIAFFDEDGEIHGLGSIMYGQNITANGEKALYLKSIERGYYRNSKLQTFGDKIFSNGNKYIGEFDNGQFHGCGILISPQQMKWVHGKFHRGQLSKIQSSNYKKFTEKDFQVWAQNLRQIHNRYRQRWIDMDIELPEQLYLYRLLKEAMDRQITHIEPDHVEVIKQKQQRMSRIQQQFETQSPGTLHNSNVQRQLDKHYSQRSSRGPIKLELSQTNSNSRKLEQGPGTPINQFLETSKVSRHSHRQNAQEQYRMEDPFKIAPIKVPSNSQPQSSRSSRRPQTISQTRGSNRNNVNNGTQIRPNIQQYRQRYINNNNHTQKDPIEPQMKGVYGHPPLDSHLRQKQKFNHELQDQIYQSRLKKGLQTSPIHRNYYTSPLKQDEEYSQRYVGKMTNKKHFNYSEAAEQILSKYPTTAKYFPPEQNIYDSRSKSPLYQSASPQTISQRAEETTYSSRKTRPVFVTKESQSGRNFIKNNYKYWS